MERIVIADDSQTARMYIRRCLEIAGIIGASVVEVKNGKEALESVRENHADLLITDLNMPVMDGETLLKWLKQCPELSEMPVLVITSAGNPAKEIQLAKLGAFNVLSKPISPSSLRAVLGPLVNDKGTYHA